ncbi:MAG: macro domain-containing protein, partial [Clostridia bacterium]|nr:macro domain-containing protein [Clostridia bacterium]
MPFKIIRNDLTKMQVDAIVNTASEEPTYGDGTDTAVYEAAGVDELLEARRKIGYLDEGQVAITPGFRLPAKYIIHAVSPFFFDGESGEEEKLRACYRESLKLAHQYGCKSIAFPLIATGSFGYPKEEGMRIAVDEINAFLFRHNMLIYLVVFDSKATQLGHHLY